jgi:hypothetical protein
VPKGAERRFARAAALAALLAVGIAQADVRILYRWTDGQGRIQYSDRPPPASFKGEVTRIEVDTETNANAPETPRVRRVAPDVLKDVTPDIAKQRREKRARLEDAVHRAEKKLAEARAALEQGGDLKDDEQGVIQRRYAKAPADKANCRVVDEGGRKSVICPAVTPNEQYYERQKSLEEAVRKAEEELSEAQTAYRRGVD